MRGMTQKIKIKITSQSITLILNDLQKTVVGSESGAKSRNLRGGGWEKRGLALPGELTFAGSGGAERH